MDHEMMKNALGKVVEDMGRAAREGKARRFVRKPGKPAMSPHDDAAEREEETGEMAPRSAEVDPVKKDMGPMSPEEMDELLNGIQR